MTVIRAARISVIALALVAATARSLRAEDAPVTETPSARPLVLLKDEQHPDIEHIEIKGDHPRVIYIPILHDNPVHRDAADDINRIIGQSLNRGRTIAEHLYGKYGVRNILLEGIPQSLADTYNAPGFRGRKLTTTRAEGGMVFTVWFNLLNRNNWRLAPAEIARTLGPLGALGAEYTERIQRSLKTAHGRGWFRSTEVFLAHRDEFIRMNEEACRGYNERLEAILKEDPGLKREYEIVAVQANRTFLDNILALDGPGIILCGKGHIQNLMEQMDERELSYMIVVPRGTMPWPPEQKDDDRIFTEMLGLGCQLRECAITLGDGTAIQIKLPIK